MTLYQLTLNWTQSGVSANNVLVYEADTELTTVQQQALVDDARAAFTAVTANTPTTTQLSNADVRRVDAPGYPTLAFSFTSGPWNGTNPADPAPRNVCVLLRKSSSTPKPNRGRMYIPFVADDVFTGSNMGVGFVANYQSVATNLIALTYDTGQDASLVIPRWSVGGDYVGQWNDAAAFTVDPLAATQRRRLRK